MKEAVVFILDASPSMNARYPANDEAETAAAAATRLDCAKAAVTGMVAELMLSSRAHEVGVLVCRTAATQHHRVAPGADAEEEGDGAPFPNVTALHHGALMKPTTGLLRRLQQVQTVTPELAAKLRGDFCDALLLAADALHERTAGRKYRRRIVLFTDADSDVVMDVAQTLVVIDALRSMECRVEVIGLDFDRAAEYRTALEVGEAGKKKAKVDGSSEQATDDREEGAAEGDDSSGTEDGGSGSSGNDDDESSEGDDNQVLYSSKEDREKLLISLTEKTGGRVVAAHTMQEILDANKGKKISSTTKFKFDLCIAPGLTLQARYASMMRRFDLPRIKSEVVMVDEENKPMKNGLGQEMTDEIKTILRYVDDDHPEDIVDPSDVTTAIRFGSDLIPMSAFDMEGLRSKKVGPVMEFLGYVDRDKVPPCYSMGPPYVITGHDSTQACAAVAALARALEKQSKVAICTFLKKKTSTAPVLGALFPMPMERAATTESSDTTGGDPIHLVFLQLPFKDEVNHLIAPGFEEYLVEEEENTSFAEGDGKTASAEQVKKATASVEAKAKACDDLIDSLMLPQDVLCSGQVPSYFVRSWNRTKIQRALNGPQDSTTFIDSRKEEDRMVTPDAVLERARPAMTTFRKTFPLELPKNGGANKKIKKNKGQRGRKIITYKDFL